MRRFFSIAVSATIGLATATALAQPLGPTATDPAAQPAGTDTGLDMPPPSPPPASPPPMAQEEIPAAPAPAADDRPAQGFALQATIPTQALASLTSVFSSGVGVGYRSDTLFIGARVGLNVLSVSPDATLTETATIFSIVPTIEYYLWQSRDGRAALDLLGSIGIGWGGISEEDTSVMPAASNDAHALFLPLAAGVGFDYFIHRNFALGLEGGYQGAILLSSATNGRSGDLGLALHGLYGAFRLTAIIGD